MSWTVVEVDGNGVRETRRGGTLAGGQSPETEPKQTKQQPSRGLTQRLVVRRSIIALWGQWVDSHEIDLDVHIPLECYSHPVETVRKAKR